MESRPVQRFDLYDDGRLEGGGVVVVVADVPSKIVQHCFVVVRGDDDVVHFSLHSSKHLGDREGDETGPSSQFQNSKRRIGSDVEFSEGESAGEDDGSAP